MPNADACSKLNGGCSGSIGRTVWTGWVGWAATEIGIGRGCWITGAGIALGIGRATGIGTGRATVAGVAATTVGCWTTTVLGFGAGAWTTGWGLGFGAATVGVGTGATVVAGFGVCATVWGSPLAWMSSAPWVLRLSSSRSANEDVVSSTSGTFGLVAVGVPPSPNKTVNGIPTAPSPIAPATMYCKSGFLLLGCESSVPWISSLFCEDDMTLPSSPWIFVVEDRIGVPSWLPISWSRRSLSKILSSLMVVIWGL